MPIKSAEDTHERRLKLLEIYEDFRAKGKMINRYTLQPALEKAGYKVSYATVYNDLTQINQKNTWVRDLAQSNYSAYQEQISQNLEWIEQQAQKQFKKTNNHVWLNIIHSVQQTKMKHTNGENINISAAMLGKKFREMSSKDTKDKEINVDVIQLASRS